MTTKTKNILKYTGAGLAALLIIFVIFVSTRDGHFRYERSGVIQAPASEVFPYISQLRLGEQWSPYDKPGSSMKKTFSGTDGQAGAAMEFEGDAQTGSGRVEILEVVPDSSVKMRLLMTQPMQADNLVTYTLTPAEGGGTLFTWVMEGEGGFMSKLMTVLIDCEKMIGGQFEEGISNLKNLLEKKPGESGSGG